jgi:hypothetical protein
MVQVSIELDLNNIKILKKGHLSIVEYVAHVLSSQTGVSKEVIYQSWLAPKSAIFSVDGHTFHIKLPSPQSFYEVAS